MWEYLYILSKKLRYRNMQRTVCLFGAFGPTREFSPHVTITHWRYANFDKYSALKVIEQWSKVFWNHLLWLHFHSKCLGNFRWVKVCALLSNQCSFFQNRRDLNSCINERSWLSKFICIAMSFSLISHDDKNKIAKISWFEDFYHNI